MTGWLYGGPNFSWGTSVARKFRVSLRSVIRRVTACFVWSVTHENSYYPISRYFFTLRLRRVWYTHPVPYKLRQQLLAGLWRIRKFIEGKRDNTRNLPVTWCLFWDVIRVNSLIHAGSSIQLDKSSTLLDKLLYWTHILYGYLEKYLVY